MHWTQIRAVLGGLLSVGAIVMACNKTKAEEATLPGPQLGESTASPPANPSAPPPDAAGVTGVSAALNARPGNAPVETPAPGPSTAAEGASSGTTAAPPSATTTPPAPSLPQDRGTTLPQDRTAPPPQPQPGAFSPPPAPPPPTTND